ncbi:MAG TPA: YerC/YecD family TrpR-related protein [Candidatus Gracilibacteria bacterium]
MKKDTARSELYQLFLLLKDEKEIETFFNDLFTPSELHALTERWQIVKRLLSGRPQREIAQELGIGIATVTRASRCLKYGPGGFEMMWKKSQES